MKTITDYAGVIAKIVGSTGDLELLPAPPTFPFPTAYKGQITAIELLTPAQEAIVSSHTGSGKTAVYLTQTINKPSLIIEPRKFLQL